MPTEFTIHQSTGRQELDRIHQLRYEILRKPHNLSFESAAFPGDDLESTIHILAQNGDLLIGCVTLMCDASKPSIQLRGMAVALENQKSGVGRSILETAHSIASQKKKSLWCNARFSAIGFYERNGWKTEGELFEIPVIGAHAVMAWSQ